MTPAQYKALMWLPGDGSWVQITGRLGKAIDSLLHMAETEYRPRPRGGEPRRFARLTAAGVAARAGERL